MARPKQARRAKRIKPAGDKKRRREVSALTWLMAAVFFALTVTLVAWGSPEIGLEVGNPADRDYLARAGFECVDLRQTEYNRQRQRRATHERYSPLPEGREAMEALRERLRRILEEIRLHGETADVLARMGLESRLAAADFVTSLSRGDSALYQQAPDILLRPFENAEILRSKDYRRVAEGTGKIRLVGEGEREVPASNLVNIDSVQEFLQAGIEGALTTPPLGAYSGNAEVVAGVLASVLRPRENLRPTAAYEHGLTEKAREEAASMVPAACKTVLPGDTIIMKNAPVERQHLVEIRAEQRAYDAVLPLAERLRVFGGSGLLLLMIFGVGAWYLSNFQPNILRSNMRFFIFAALLALVMLAAKLIVLKGWQVYLIPISFAAMVLAIAYSPRTSLAVSWMLAAVISLMAGMNLVLFFYLLAGSAVSAFGSARIRKRSKIIKVGMLTGLAYVMVIWGEGLLTGGVNDRAIIFNSGWGLFNGLLVAFLISGILPFIEKWFNITTDISLLELSDQNHPLIRRLIFSAPGTYHHSLIVGNLAEEASEAIGANALLARVGSYFHDVGKLLRPDYFIENEPTPGAKHSKLTTPMSTTIILAHTKDGEELAREYKLPNAVRAIIKQHHGTSILEYFYHEALEEFGGPAEVEEASFRYSGPKPQTREAGIVLLADACEAASRALDEPTSKRIEGLVNSIVTRKMEDGQLDECGLSLTDIAKIKDAFVRILSARFHTRIKYPEAPPAKKGEPSPKRQATSFYTRRRQFDL
jgi:putative nucleotidyltransferase with HDIG domain